MADILCAASKSPVAIASLKSSLMSALPELNVHVLYLFGSQVADHRYIRDYRRRRNRLMVHGPAGFTNGYEFGPLLSTGKRIVG